MYMTFEVKAKSKISKFELEIYKTDYDDNAWIWTWL